MLLVCQGNRYEQEKLLKQSNTLYVGNLSFYTTEEQVRSSVKHSALLGEFIFIIFSLHCDLSKLILARFTFEIDFPFW